MNAFSGISCLGKQDISVGHLLDLHDHNFLCRLLDKNSNGELNYKELILALWCFQQAHVEHEILGEYFDSLQVIIV